MTDRRGASSSTASRWTGRGAGAALVAPMRSAPACRACLEGRTRTTPRLRPAPSPAMDAADTAGWRAVARWPQGSRGGPASRPPPRTADGASRRASPPEDATSRRRLRAPASPRPLHRRPTRRFGRVRTRLRSKAQARQVDDIRLAWSHTDDPGTRSPHVRGDPPGSRVSHPMTRRRAASPSRHAAHQPIDQPIAQMLQRWCGHRLTRGTRHTRDRVEPVDTCAEKCYGFSCGARSRSGPVRSRFPGAQRVAARRDRWRRRAVRGGTGDHP